MLHDPVADRNNLEFVSHLSYFSPLCYAFSTPIIRPVMALLFQAPVASVRNQGSDYISEDRAVLDR